MKDLGNRMKMYEAQEAQRKFLPLLPICTRIDGRCFSKFTKGLDRPFDTGMIDLMKATTKYLVEETQADIGYTQSDEITLVWKNNTYDSEIFFNGKIQKMCSSLTSLTVGFFNQNIAKYIPSKKDQLANFDCRVWQVPTLDEAANLLLWRERDAVKNSISMLGFEYFSNKQLFKKTGNDIQNMLLTEHNINWNDCPISFKRGSYVVKETVWKKLSEKDLESLPEKHNARKNPDVKFKRSSIGFANFPSMNKVSNKKDVYFNNRLAEYYEE